MVANAFGASAPGLEVIVTSGRAVVFEGITDADGRFATTPLPPGIYTFEVRVPKTVGTESRYFLALSGAKPITQPLMRRDVAIMMDAQVRSARPVRGQVTARHVTIFTSPANTSPDATPVTVPTANRRAVAPPVTTSTPASAAGATSVRVPVAATPSSAGPAAYQQRVINGRLHVWQPLAPGSKLGRWVPEQPGGVRPAGQPASAPQAATTTAVPAPVGRTSAVAARATRTVAPAPQRRIINGKWHTWQPAEPGSTLGRWVPEQLASARAPAASSMTRTNVPAATGTSAPVARAAVVRAPVVAQTTPASPAASQRRIINGKWHAWQPTAPGSSSGRWVPEGPQRAQPVTQPTPSATPAPTRSNRSSSPRR